MQQPTAGGLGPPHHLVARGEEAPARGRYKDAISQFRQGFELLKARPSAAFYVTAMSLARAWHETGDTSQEILVLEEAARTLPAYVAPGFPAAWWIKAQTHLARAYREGSRTAEGAFRTVFPRAAGHRATALGLGGPRQHLLRQNQLT